MRQKRQGVRAELAANSHVRELEAVVQESDSPMPAASELALLHKIRPDLVDHCIKEHQIEAEYQRKRFRRIDCFVFAERFFGLICASGITIAAFVVAYLLAMADHELPACVVVGGTLGGIVAAILNQRKAR